MQQDDYTGRQLGNYRLTKKLGTGGFASVYLGEHNFLKSKVAAKISKALNPSDQTRDTFLNEARFISSLSHNHIVRVLDCRVEQEISGNLPYIDSVGKVRKGILTRCHRP